MNRPDVRKLLEAGHAARASEKAKKEAAVAGHPRVGTVGIVAEDGKIYGVCHRKALARSMGIEETPNLGTRIMWRNGEVHEDTWLDLFAKAGDEFTAVHQAEVKAKIDGVDLELLGHPDIVLADAEGKRVLGIEHKGVFSYSTAALVHFENRPKNENLIQAAAYSHFLKLPYELWYTNPSYFSIPIYDKKKYGSRSIPPFYKGFKLDWQSGYLWYQAEGCDWVETPVTPAAIEDYYRLVAEMPREKQLGPRVSGDYLDGTPNKWGDNNECKFCCFAPACDKYESEPGFDTWLREIKVLSQSEEKT